MRRPHRSSFWRVSCVTFFAFLTLFGFVNDGGLRHVGENRAEYISAPRTAARPSHQAMEQVGDRAQQHDHHHGSRHAYRRALAPPLKNDIAPSK
jgi:hypothetical protein